MHDIASTWLFANFSSGYDVSAFSLEVFDVTKSVNKGSFSPIMWDYLISKNI